MDVLKIIILLFLSCLNFLNGSKLNKNGVNVVENIFYVTSYYQNTAYRTEIETYETCCQKFIFCLKKCMRYRTKQKSFLQQRSKKQIAYSYNCKKGWSRIGDAPGCERPICNPYCQNGECVSPNTCKCKEGFEGRLCERDINECVGSNGGCDQICVNLVGTYRCSCNAGFKLNENQHGCDDINECKKNEEDNEEAKKRGGVLKYLCQCYVPSESCKATCVNNEGGYYCKCSAGFMLVVGKVCVDIDECAAGTSGCDQICLNKMGGHICSCKRGYSLLKDGRTCADINECVLGSNGGCDQICVNVVGTYRCSCNAGFKLNEDQHGCNVSSRGDPGRGFQPSR